jgi:bifunctional non-homologous end joining protein LigD
VDGYRMLAYKDGDQVRLISRQGKDFTKRFPELVAAIRGLRLILDGEVAVYDEQLVGSSGSGTRRGSRWSSAAGN